MRTDNREMQYMQTGTVAAKSILTGLLIGGAIGDVTMMLFAPRSGEETRAQIRDKAIELRDKTTDTVKDTVSQAKSKASDIRDTISDTAGNLKERSKHVLTRQLDHVAEAAENGKKTVKEY
jgi:gas vesicle protein